MFGARCHYFGFGNLLTPISSCPAEGLSSNRQGPDPDAFPSSRRRISNTFLSFSLLPESGTTSHITDKPGSFAFAIALPVNAKSYMPGRHGNLLIEQAQTLSSTVDDGRCLCLQWFKNTQRLCTENPQLASAEMRGTRRQPDKICG